jgi:hypothetical protein
MAIKFKQIGEFKADKFIRNMDKTNIFKHMLMQKKVTRSVLKNFFLMIYFLYLRLSLELGTAMLSRTEAFIVNIFYLFIFLAVIEQFSRYIFSILAKMPGLFMEILWIYKNIDLIRKMERKN